MNFSYLEKEQIMMSLHNLFPPQDTASLYFGGIFYGITIDSISLRSVSSHLSLQNCLLWFYRFLWIRHFVFFICITNICSWGHFSHLIIWQWTFHKHFPVYVKTHSKRFNFNEVVVICQLFNNVVTFIAQNRCNLIHLGSQ